MNKHSTLQAPSVEEVEKLIEDFSKIMTDFPRAWEVCKKAGAREEHHEKCSWRTHQMLCDCAASQAFLYSIDNFVTPYQKIVPFIRSLQARIKELQTLENAVTCLQLALARVRSADPTVSRGKTELQDLIVVVERCIRVLPKQFPSPSQQ